MNKKEINKVFPASPLTLNEIQKIDQTNLSVLERHHLRLLAHCLACFKCMANDSSKGELPDHQQRLKWCLNQPHIEKDQEFIDLVLDQFSGASIQLQELADDIAMEPLELTLDHLIKASIKISST
tara:strand:- start:98 stop:472 length:375 start_codon:yes stop_codon:yes gene_type:complete